MKKIPFIALTLATVLTGCSTTPDTEESTADQLITNNLESYKLYKKDNITPVFKDELANCYQDGSITVGDGYTVKVFNTKIRNSSNDDYVAESLSFGQQTLRMYRDTENTTDITFMINEDPDNKAVIEDTTLATFMSSKSVMSYISGYDSTKEEFDIDTVDYGLDVMVGEVKPGKFAFSITDSELVALKVDEVDGIRIESPEKRTNSWFQYTNKSHTQSVSHTIDNNSGFLSEIMGDLNVTTSVLDVYICHDDSFESPKEKVEVEKPLDDKASSDDAVEKDAETEAET